MLILSIYVFKFMDKKVTYNYVENSLLKSLNLIKELSELEIFIKNTIEASDFIIDSITNNKFIFLAGNGGSAAHSQHFAAELICRFNFDRNPLPALALTTDSSVITAISNDYGYENIFERQISGLSKKGDVFIGLTTSGTSKNIIKAFKRAKILKLKTIAICGGNGIPKSDFIPDVEISIPSKVTSLIQEMHGITTHLICDIVEKTIFSELK